MSLGFIVGAYLITKVVETKTPVYDLLRLSKILPLLFIGIGLSAINFSNTIIMIWISFLMLLNGVANSFFNIPFSIWLQKNIPTNMQGRVFHLLGVICTCIQPVGIIIYVILFDNKQGNPIIWDSSIFMISGLLMYISVLIYTKFGKYDLKNAVILKNKEKLGGLVDEI